MEGVGRYRDEDDAATGSGDPDMQDFYSKVEAIQAKMDSMVSRQQRLIALHEEGKTAVQNVRVRQIKDEMASETQQITQTAKIIKNELNFLDALNERSLSKKGCEVGSNTERTRTGITSSLKQKLAKIMDEFTALRRNIMNQYRDVVERRFYTVTGDAPTEEQVDQLIETGEAENLFQKAILAQGKGKLLDTLNEINERHEAVKELNKALLELNQMFLDMAALVEQQGAQLDNIEKQVSRAKDHVHSGVEQLRQAKTLAKNTRKWMCCALIIGLIILAIIVVAVVQPWKSGNA